MNQKNTDSAIETVGLFTDPDAVQEVVTELEIGGLERRQISILSGESDLGEQFGTRHIPSKRLEDNPYAPRTHYPKKEEMALAETALICGGFLAGSIISYLAATGLSVGATIVSAFTGGILGLAMGAFFARRLYNWYEKRFDKQIEKGGTVVWVNTPTQEMRTLAETVMRKYGAKDIHVHRVDERTSVA
jgi:hypothetical protein